MDAQKTPGRELPDTSPGGLLGFLAVVVSRLPGLIASWSSSHLMQLHDMAQQVAGAAAEALAAKDRPGS